MAATMKVLSFLLHFAFIFTFTQAKPISPQFQPLTSFKLNNTQNAGTCTYTATVETSCSSPRTRDRIFFAFGDAYGNRVYDGRPRTFGRCSFHTFRVNGTIPCVQDVCYVAFYRDGSDGWIVNTVKISGPYTKPVVFHTYSEIPQRVWFSFSHCFGASASPPLSK